MTDQRSDDANLPDGTPSLDGDGVANDAIADAQQVPMDDAAGGPQADNAPDETYDEGDTATEELTVQGGE